MRFRDKEFTPGEYQHQFLCFTDELVPEVLETLKSLAPKYQKVFGAFSREHRKRLFNKLIANSTQKGNYILYNLDDAMQHYKPNAPEPDANKNQVLKNFLEFREDFYNFIERYYLEKDWLKEKLFAFLYDLAEYPQHYELTDAYERKTGEEPCSKLALAFGDGANPFTGDPVHFEFDGWRISEESKDFEKAAQAAFKNHLRDYIKRTADQAKAHGYKRATGKNALKNVKWLVYWNKYNFKYLWEIIEHIPEFNEEFDVNNSEDRETAANRLIDAFNKFESFDLPVRPFGKNRENLT